MLERSGHRVPDVEKLPSPRPEPKRVFSDEQIAQLNDAAAGRSPRSPSAAGRFHIQEPSGVLATVYEGRDDEWHTGAHRDRIPLGLVAHRVDLRAKIGTVNERTDHRCAEPEAEDGPARRRGADAAVARVCRLDRPGVDRVALQAVAGGGGEREQREQCAGGSHAPAHTARPRTLLPSRAMSTSKPWGRRLPADLPGPAGWDAIVIGSGMGGMTCAAMLAKLGQRVLVLEQHYIPGGFTHSFKRPGGYHWDVGVHAVGEVTERSLTGRLLRRLTDDRLRWASLGPVYDSFDFPDGVHIDFPDTPQRFRDNLLELFPDERDAIDGYLHRVRDVAGAMRSYYLARLLPARAGRLAESVMARPARQAFAEHTKDVLDRLTGNDRLKSVLAAQWAYHGSPPSRASFAIQALVSKHFMHGGYYPVGGSTQIAAQLLQTVADSGGYTRISADVAQIIVERGVAVGVRLRDGEELRARRIVSAAGALATVDRLLPGEYATQDWVASIRRLAPAPAHVCLYLGFKGDIRAAGAGPANRWFYDTWSTEVDAWQIAHVPQDSLPDAPVLYCSFPSLKDPEHDPGPDQRHTGEVVTFVPWDRFAGWLGTRWHKRGADYDGLKNQLQDSLLRQFLTKMPGLRGMIDHVELSTPLTTDHFVRPTRGSIYGLEPTPERFANPHLRPRSPIPGLLLAGSDVATVGVIGAMMGGVLAAASAEPRRALALLRGL